MTSNASDAVVLPPLSMTRRACYASPPCLSRKKNISSRRILPQAELLQKQILDVFDAIVAYSCLSGEVERSVGRTCGVPGVAPGGAQESEFVSGG